ncbi:MAG: HEAT repeat domain-containing protein, partial [Pseudomonadota bacterium]
VARFVDALRRMRREDVDDDAAVRIVVAQSAEPGELQRALAAQVTDLAPETRLVVLIIKCEERWTLVVGDVAKRRLVGPVDGAASWRPDLMVGVRATLARAPAFAGLGIEAWHVQACAVRHGPRQGLQRLDSGDDDGGLSALMGFVRDPNPKTRERAIAAIARAAPDRLRPLLGLLMADDSAEVRCLAIRALEPGEREASDLALRDPSPLVRRAALEA